MMCVGADDGQMMGSVFIDLTLVKKYMERVAES